MITRKVQKNFILLLEKAKEKNKNYKIYETINTINNLSEILTKIVKKDEKILKEFKISDFNNNSNELNEKAKKIIKWYFMFPNFKKLFIHIWKIEPREKDKNVFNTLVKCHDIFAESRNKKIMEVAPPSEKIEEFIKKNKESFKKRYGKDWERILYATAWKMYGKQKEK